MRRSTASLIIFSLGLIATHLIHPVTAAVESVVAPAPGSMPVPPKKSTKAGSPVMQPGPKKMRPDDGAAIGAGIESASAVEGDSVAMAGASAVEGDSVAMAGAPAVEGDSVSMEQATALEGDKGSMAGPPAVEGGAQVEGASAVDGQIAGRCSCDPTTISERRRARASFTEAKADTPSILTARVPQEWTALYISPTLDTPNNTRDTVFFQSEITFSHAVQYVNSANIRYYTDALTNVLTTAAPTLTEAREPVCTGGFVEPAPPFAPENDAFITSVYMAENCSVMYVRGYAPLLGPLSTNATNLVTEMSSSALVDSCGSGFKGSTATTPILSRQVAEMYAIGLAFTPRLGPATEKPFIKIAIVFTQEIPKIDSKCFEVTGPRPGFYRIGKVSKEEGDQFYYSFDLQVAEGYYGSVNVTLAEKFAKKVLPNDPAPSVAFQKLAVQC